MYHPISCWIGMASTTSLMNELRLAEARPSLACAKSSSCELPWRPSLHALRYPNTGPRLAMVGAPRAAATAEKRKAFYPGEDKGFVEEMRFVAMKLHRKDQSSEGEKEAGADDKPLIKWEPSVAGYIKFLVDSKVVYDTMESIVQEAPHPSYAEFRNTGLERVARLAKDLEWLKGKGYEIPEPGEPGSSYAAYLKELAEKDPPSFICHFYNVYFAHSAGGRMIGKQVADKILDGAELEFYKWDKDLKETLASVREKLNKVAESWTREEKNRCLQETEKSFKNSGKILRLIVS